MPHAARPAKELFLDLLELGAEARTRELAALRERDPDLAERVESLLAGHARAADLVPAGAPERRTTTLAPGRTIGDYELAEVVGEGGAGVVYRARQVSLGRVVALKLLRAGRFATESELARFRAESEVAARLDHPRIVPVYEVGMLDGVPYFSMKLIEGANLAEHAPVLRGDPARCAALVAEVARAVHHGHQRGVLHRDLKPSNVLLDAAGAPHVADFGIAKRLDARGPRTYTGSFRGTPAYMAPEQVSGREVTVRTDVYALGGMLYELLTGRPPALGEALAEVLHGVRELDPPGARTLDPRVPLDLETICARCLAKDPARRYGSALELARELERWLAGEPIRARPVSLLERGWLFSRRRPLVASLVLTVAVLAATLTVGAIASSMRLGEHLSRARRAEEIANERLRASLLAGARLHRASLRPGRRGEALALLREAAGLGSGPALLDEAIACIVLPDLEVEEEWPEPDGVLALGFDPALERRLRRTAEGEVVLEGPGIRIRRLGESAGPRPWVAVHDPSGRFLALKRHGRNDREDPLLEVWDLEREVCILRRPESISGRALALGPGASFLSYGTRDRRLVLVDPFSGSDRASLDLSGIALELRLDPSGTRLGLALASGVAEVRDASDGTLLASFDHGPEVYSLDFDPLGRRLVTGCADQGVHVWDIESGKHLRRLDGHQAEVVHVRASPDGRWLISYAWDETAILWDAASGGRVLAASAKPLEFSADGARLAFATSRGHGIWKLVGGEALATRFGHEGKSPIALAISPAGDLLASGGPDGVLLSRLADGAVLARPALAEVKAVRFEPSGALLVASEQMGLARIPPGGEGPHSILVPGRCAALTLPTGGEWIAAVVDGELLLLDPGGGVRARAQGPVGLHRLACSADGRWLGGGNWHGEGASLFDPVSAALLVDLAPGERGVEVVFDPAGERVVVACGREFRVHRTGTFELERVIPRELDLAARPGAAAFSPDGRVLALALTHRLVRLHDAATGEVLARLEPADPQLLSALCFSPDGARLVAGTQSQRVVIWDFGRLDEALRGAGLGTLPPPLGRP